MASERSGQPSKMTIGNLDNQKKTENTKVFIDSLKELIDGKELSLVVQLLQTMKQKDEHTVEVKAQNFCDNLWAVLQKKNSNLLALTNCLNQLIGYIPPKFKTLVADYFK